MCKHLSDDDDMIMPCVAEWQMEERRLKSEEHYRWSVESDAAWFSRGMPSIRIRHAVASSLCCIHVRSDFRIWNWLPMVFLKPCGPETGRKFAAAKTRGLLTFLAK